MSTSGKNSIIFRTIAGVMACVFLFHETALAGDLIDVMMDKLNADQSRMFAPSYIKEQESLQEDLIGRKQGLEDLQTLNTAAVQTDKKTPEIIMPELQKRSGSGQPQSQPPPEETILAQDIAMAQEGLEIAGQDLRDANGLVYSKAAELAGVADKLAVLEAEHADISQALKALAEESLSCQIGLNGAESYLDRMEGEKAALEEKLGGLERDLDSKREIAARVSQELQFAKLDYDNTVSLIHKALGDDFDMNGSAYDRSHGSDGKVTSVTLAGARSELDALTAAAKGRVDEGVAASLAELARKVEAARNSVYDDEAASLAQLDALCIQREQDIIAQRDQGLIDIEAERVRVTAEADSRFGALYNSYSAQANYWGAVKASLYQSGNIGAYIYAAAMADAFSNQADSIWYQWKGQIANINRQCDDAIVRLRDDAAAAIAGIPSEKEAAILEIQGQRDALLKQIDDAKLGQEAAIYAGRDSAIAGIDSQAADALSAIRAEESLILAAWQISYLIEDLAAESAQEEAALSAAQALYDEGVGSFNLFVEGTLDPARDAYDAALAAYEKTLSDIASGESDLSANAAAMAVLDGKIALLSAELSALEDDAAGKLDYYNEVQGLLNDLLDAERLFLLQKYLAENTVLPEEEEPEGVFENSVPGGDAPKPGAGSPEPLSVGAIDQPAYGPAGGMPEPPPDGTPAFVQTPVYKDAKIPAEAKADHGEDKLPLRSEEAPVIDPVEDPAAPDYEISLLERFRELFGREPSEYALKIFGNIMLLPGLPDIKLIDPAGEITIDDKKYIFNDDGGMDRVLDKNNNEILKYLYNINGDLSAIDFSGARKALEDTEGSASGSVADRFGQYRAALEGQRTLIESRVAEKFAEYSKAIEAKAQALRDEVAEQYFGRKALLDGERAKLEALEGYLEKKAASFNGLQMDGRVYDAAGARDEMEKVRSRISDVDGMMQKIDEGREGALRIIEAERLKAADNLDSEKASVLGKLGFEIEGVEEGLADAERSIMSGLSRDAGEALSAIEVQEDHALIRYYFKEILGREPTYSEMSYCRENGYTTKESLIEGALKDELAERQAFKDAVIEQVGSALKEGRFNSLSRDEKDAIIRYLGGQSLHFGTSALLPLLDALKRQGLDADGALLLAELILKEIEDGNLDYRSGAPLRLSMNAMIAIAGSHGLELAGYNVTPDELDAAMRKSGEPAIALINENHYITVLGMDEKTVTYFDPSLGKNGADVTIPREEFKNKFSGNVITRIDKLDNSALLSKDKLMAAKGADFWGSIWGFFCGVGEFFCDLFTNIGRIIADVATAVWNGIQAAVNTIAEVAKAIVMIPVNFVNNIIEGNWADALWTLGSFIPGVGAIHSAIDGDWLGAGIQVGTLLLSAGLPGISAAVSGIGQTIGEFASGIIAPIADAISPLLSGVSSVVNAVAGSISNIVKPFSDAIGGVFKPVIDFTSDIVSAIGSSPIGQFVLQPIVAAGILEGSKVTLKELGVDDTIANIGSAAFTAYTAAGMGGNADLAVPITLGAVASASFKEIGDALDLNKTLTGALSLIGGEFVAMTAISAGLADSAEGGTYTFDTEDGLGDLADFSEFEFGDVWSGDPMATSSIADNPTYAIYSAIDSVVMSENLRNAAVGALTNNPTSAYITASELLNYLSLLINARKDSGQSNTGPGGLVYDAVSYGSDIANTFLLMNGINNKEPFTVPKYIDTFASHLKTASPGDEKIIEIPLYNDIPGGNPYAILGIDNFGIDTDAGRDVANYLVKTDKIAADIYNNVTAQNGGKWPAQATAMCYSGAGDPFLNLLNIHEELDVESVVLVGTPLTGGRGIERTNLKTVVTIYGDDDGIFFWNQILRKDFFAKTCKLFSNSTKQVDEVVIKLEGIGHNGYFYDPSNPGFNSAKNKKASEFIAKVTALAKDPRLLEKFLLEETGGGVYQEEESEKYVVDLKKVIYGR